MSADADQLTLAEGADHARMIRGHLNLMANVADLGARTYVLHIGPKLPDEPPAAAWDRVRRALDELAPQAQALGLALALENSFTDTYMAQDAEALAAFVADYGAPAVGVCYDSGHAHMAGGAVPVLKTLAPHVVTVHLHDNHGTEDEHLPPGHGTIDWPALVPVLAQCPKLVHIETEAKDCALWPHGQVYASYLKVLNAPGGRLVCR